MKKLFLTALSIVLLIALIPIQPICVRVVLLVYLSITILDGMVTAVTGQSDGWWVSQAIIQILNKQFTSTTTMSGDVYPPNSYEDAMCRAAQL